MYYYYFLKKKKLFINFICSQGQNDSGLCLKTVKGEEFTQLQVQQNKDEAWIQFQLLFTSSARKAYKHFGLRTEKKFTHPPPTVAFLHKSITNWSSTYRITFMLHPLRIRKCLACLALIWTWQKRDNTAIAHWSHDR